MIQVVLIIVVLFFLYFVLSPFFEEAYRRKRIADNEDRKSLLLQKEEILEALHDLEYDFKLNKVTAADYQEMKEKLTGQAVIVMKNLDSIEKKTEQDAVHAETSKSRARKKVHS